jgi:hypothetical protein
MDIFPSMHTACVLVGGRGECLILLVNRLPHQFVPSFRGSEGETKSSSPLSHRWSGLAFILDHTGRRYSITTEVHAETKVPRHSSCVSIHNFLLSDSYLVDNSQVHVVRVPKSSLLHCFAACTRWPIGSEPILALPHSRLHADFQVLSLVLFASVHDIQTRSSLPESGRK